MVTITFPNRETEKRALAYLLGRFSGRVLRTGEHLVPEAALEGLGNLNIPFTVLDDSTFEKQLAGIRRKHTNEDLGDRISGFCAGGGVAMLGGIVALVAYG